MANFFPRQTIEMKLEEPKAFRRLSFSLVEMAIITGIVTRLFRLVALTYGPNNWFYLGGTLFVGLAFLVGMTTAHLSNYPLHQYAWRAPLYAVIEVAAEMVTSALFIVMHLERNGAVAAHWDDWGGMAFNALWIRGLIIILWTLILAGIVQIVRRTIVNEDPEIPSVTPSKG